MRLKYIVYSYVSKYPEVQSLSDAAKLALSKTMTAFRQFRLANDSLDPMVPDSDLFCVVTGVIDKMLNPAETV